VEKYVMTNILKHFLGVIIKVITLISKAFASSIYFDEKRGKVLKCLLFRKTLYFWPWFQLISFPNASEHSLRSISH